MGIKRLGRIGTAAMLVVTAVSFMLAGCGSSGGGISSQVVSGVASVGATLAGQVTLKDASNRQKTTVIGSDGTYAIDVTGMKAPFIMEASGSTGGTNYTLHSFSDGAGTANINPLSDAAVANAAGVSDPSQLFSTADMVMLEKISSQLNTTVATLMAKLQPLLALYSATNQNPITSQYAVNHTGLDGLFDHVKITLANGSLTITDATTGAIIFTGQISDMANWNFPSNPSVTSPPAPMAPAGVTAVGGIGQVTLIWNTVSNATSYNVYYSTTTGVTTTNGTKVAGAASPYVQTGLSAGTTYYFIITALNSAGESAPCAQVSATTTVAPPPPPPIPAAPTGVTATGGTKQVTVSWPAVSGATSYNLYWSTTSGVTTTSGTKIAGVTSPAVQMGLNDSTTYYYVVTAVNASGESASSVQVAATTLAPAPAPTPPAAPTGVTAMGGANQTTISWPAVTGAASYNIYWSTASGAGTGGTRIAGVTSPYVQTGLSAGTTYYYVVTAVNSVGESAASTQASATTNAPPPAVPAAPTGVTATGGANQTTVSWSAASGATSYNLYWSKTSGVTMATGTKITGATSPYIQTGLTAGTAYYYIVTAVNASGESPASTQVMATTNPPPVVIPAAPTGVTATGGANQVTVSWSMVSGATSYNIYWSTTSGVTTATGTKIAGATTPYVQTGLAAGTTYYYVVTAVSSAGESAASAQATATTAAAFDALSFYKTSCLGCHGTLGPRTAAQITSAIASVSAMSQYRSTGSNPLTAAQIAAIAAVSY